MDKFYNTMFGSLSDIYSLTIEDISAKEFLLIETFYNKSNISKYSYQYYFSGYINNDIAYIIYRDNSNDYYLCTKDISFSIPSVFFNDYLGTISKQIDNNIIRYDTDPHGNRELTTFKDNYIEKEKITSIMNPSRDIDILSNTLSYIGRYFNSEDIYDINNVFNDRYVYCSEKKIKINNNDMSLNGDIYYLWDSKNTLVNRSKPRIIVGSIDYREGKYLDTNHFAFQLNDNKYDMLVISNLFKCYKDVYNYLIKYGINLEHSTYFINSINYPLFIPKLIYLIRELINEYLELERQNIDDTNLEFNYNDIDVLKKQSVKSLRIKRCK